MRAFIKTALNLSISRLTLIVSQKYPWSVPSCYEIERGTVEAEYGNEAASSGCDFPLFADVPVNVKLCHYKVECSSANEPERSLKVFQVCATVSTRE
jgi:hypothetical protein